MIRIDLAMNYASLQGDISADMSRGRVSSARKWVSEGGDWEE